MMTVCACRRIAMATITMVAAVQASGCGSSGISEEPSADATRVPDSATAITSEYSAIRDALRIGRISAADVPAARAALMRLKLTSPHHIESIYPLGLDLAEDPGDVMVFVRHNSNKQATSKFVIVGKDLTVKKVIGGY